MDADAEGFHGGAYRIGDRGVKLPGTDIRQNGIVCESAVHMNPYYFHVLANVLKTCGTLNTMAAGDMGFGGGLYVDDSQGVLVDENLFTRNTAHADWECPDQGGGGFGGAPVIVGAPGVPAQEKKVVLCKDCNAENEVGARFCTTCGGKM